MERIGIRELRQHASRYLALVEAGQTVEVTDRGRLVALLTPVPAERTTVERLIAEGRLLPAENPTGRLLSPPLPARPGEPSLSQILEESRASERLL